MSVFNQASARTDTGQKKNKKMYLKMSPFKQQQKQQLLPAFELECASIES